MYSVFSKRELAFTFAIYHRTSVCLVVCLQHWCTLLRRLKFSAIFLRHLVCWPFVDILEKFYGDRLRGTPLSGVAGYSDFGPIEWYISETVQDSSEISINH